MIRFICFVIKTESHCVCRFARPQCVHIIGALYTSRVCFVGGGGGKRERE